MIYVIWKDSNYNVLHGWDSCTETGSTKVDYKDTPLVHGPVPVGSESTPQVVNITISKFPGASNPTPTQPITDCTFKLQKFYSDPTGVTYQIPDSYGSYTFCDGTSQSQSYSGYSGSATEDDDYTRLAETWPSLTPACGLMISMDGNCTFELVTPSGPTLKKEAGGSANSNDGEISPGRHAQVSFKIKVPDSTIYEGGTIQILTALEYTFTE